MEDPRPILPYASVENRPRNPLATAGFVLGLLAFVLGLLTGIPGLILSILGLVFGLAILGLGLVALNVLRMHGMPPIRRRLLP